MTSLHTLQRVMVSYQWCMVGYASNLALTIIKVIFEKNRVRVYPYTPCVWFTPCMHAL